MNGRWRGQAGMSLVELMVAVSVLAVVTAIVYGSFARTAAARDHALARAKVFAEARSAFSWLERDLRGSFATGNLPAAIPRFWADISTNSTIAVDAETTVLDLTLLSARGTTPIEGLGPLPLDDRADQARVAYRLATGSDGMDLIRYERRPPGPIDDDSSVRTVVASGLGWLEIRFFDGKRWQARWAGQAAQRRAPEAAEIRLGFTDKLGGEPLVLSSSTQIPALAHD